MYRQLQRRTGRLVLMLCSCWVLSGTRAAAAPSEECFDEAFYLKTYPDVAAAVRAKGFVSGKSHYEIFGKKEGRLPCPAAAGATAPSPVPAVPAVPACFDEQFYLHHNPDVAEAVAGGHMRSALQHFQDFGRKEGRAGCPSALERPARLGAIADAVEKIPRSAKVVLLVAAWLLAVVLGRKRSWSPTTLAVALAACMAVFVYLDYITASRVFIFHDIASDTALQFWPTMNFDAARIRAGELPMWSFQAGLGENVFPVWLNDPFCLLGILAGPRWLPYTLGPLQVLKILLAVFFAARYFQLLGYSRTATIAISLSIGFCGHIISRGTWYEYATEVVFVTFYLYAVERFAQTGKFVLLALSICLIGCAGSFNAFHYFFVFTTFTVGRIFFFGDALYARPGTVFARWLVASAAGVLMVGALLLPDFLTTIGSTRVSGSAEVLSEGYRTPWFEIQDHKEMVTAIARQISPNLLGSANRFTGFLNYLEAPLGYVGLLPLLCLIPLFVLAKRRLRIVIAVFLTAVIAYHCSAYFLLLMDGFAGRFFKISNLWVAMGLALSAAKALDLIERRGGAPTLAVAASVAVLALLLAIVFFVARSQGMTPDKHLGKIIVLVALGLAAFLWKFGRPVSGAWVSYGLIALVCFDLTINAYQSVATDRGSLDGLAPRAQAGYEDEAQAVIRQLRASDPSVYRIERDKNSVHLLDAEMQGYYGTHEYMSFINRWYVQFVWDLGLHEPTSQSSSYLEWLGPRGAVLPLLGVKYYLSWTDTPPFGYSKQSQEGPIGVFVNRQSEMGRFYPQAISPAEFASLALVERQAALLRAAVLEGASASVRTVSAGQLRGQVSGLLRGCSDKESCFLPASVHDELERLAAEPVRLTKFENNDVRLSVSAREAGVLFLSIPYDSGWHLRVDGQERPLQHVNIGFIGADLPPGEHELILKYRTPGLLPGALASCAAILFLAGWSLLLRRRKKIPQAGVGAAA